MPRKSTEGGTPKKSKGAANPEGVDGQVQRSPTPIEGPRPSMEVLTTEILQLAEGTADSLLALVTTDEGREPEAREQTYKSIREFLRKLARVVPLPADYAKAWKAKYPPTKKGPDGESVRQKNMGKPDVPYTEKPLSRAFEAIVRHASTRPELPVEYVLAYSRNEVQKALLEDLGIRLPEWLDRATIVNKTCNYLRSLNEKINNEAMEPDEQHTRIRHAPESDLKSARLPARPKTPYRELMEHIERFLQANPERSEAVLEGCKEIVERFRSLGTQRVLGIKDAVRITGWSETRIYQLTDEEGLGEKVGTRWKFSEKELYEASQKERKVGRPLKHAKP